MPEEAQKLLDSLPRDVLNWIVQGCIALIFAMIIYIFNGKLDEIDNKFESLSKSQITLESHSNSRADRLSNGQDLIITQMNEIKVKLAVFENLIRIYQNQLDDLVRKQQQDMNKRSNP